jgi:hypothetical protein
MVGITADETEVRALRTGEEERVREVVEVTRVSGRVLPPKRDLAERVGEGVAECRDVETGLGGSERTGNDIHCLPYNVCNFLPVSRTMIMLSTTRGGLIATPTQKR